MRVLIVSFGVVPAPSRHGVVFDNLLKALAPRYEVDALTLRDAEMPYVQRYRGARMLRVPVEGSAPQRIKTFQRAVRRQIEGSDYDVIHVRDAPSAVPVCEMKPYHGARVVFEVQAEAVDPDGSHGARRPDLGPQQLACLERSDLALVRGREAVEVIQKAVPNARIALLPPAVDVDAFDWEPVFARGAAAGAGDGKGEGRRLVYVGAVAEGVGLEHVIDAMPLVLEHERARLVLAGPARGAAWPRLHARARALGLDEHVALCQPIDHDDVARFLAGASVGLVPDVPGGGLGGCPGKLLEYAACRLPIVAPGAPVVRSLWQEGVDLETFEPSAAPANALSRAIVRLLADEQRSRRLAASAYERVRTRMTAAAARRKLLSAYLGLVPDAEARPPAPAVPRAALEGSGTMTQTRRASTGRDTDVSPMPLDGGDLAAPVVAQIAGEDFSAGSKLDRRNRSGKQLD